MLLKRIVALLFLLAVFTSQSGYYFLYVYQQYEAREAMEREMLANLPDDKLEIIIEENYRNRLYWEEDGKEFQLDGEMYDVVKTKEKDGRVLLYCIKDKKEKQVLEGLAKTVKHASDKNNRSAKCFAKIVAADYETSRSELLPDLSLFLQLNYVSFTAILISPYQEIHSPPPKA